MTGSSQRRFQTLAWISAGATYLLIVFGSIVRITGSGMGCGDDWPLCNGHLFPPLDDLATVIEWGHRQLAALVSMLVLATAAYAWWLRQSAVRDARYAPSTAAYWAAGLLIVQVLLGAVTVKLELPHWTVILHLITAMMLLGALLLSAVGYRRSAADSPRLTADRVALLLGFLVVLLGGMTAKMGAAGACTGFPLCNGQLWPTGGGLQHLHWIHRLTAYALAGHVIGWAIRSGRSGARRQIAPWIILGLVTLQVLVAAVMVLNGLPAALQALHVAVGTAVWAGLVLTATASRRGAEIEASRKGVTA
jgi:heme A synthase